MTATGERITSLREEYALLGEDVSGLSDLELLSREVGLLHTEKRKIENAYSTMLQDRVNHERAVRIAARRSAEDDRIAWAGMYLAQLVSRRAHTINAIIHRAAELPDGRVPVEQIRELRDAAQKAKWTMSGLVGHGGIQLEDARRQNEAIALVEKQQGEIWRLRDAITEQGRRLHSEHAQSGGRCECPGCALIRAMDDVAVADVPDSV